MDFNSFKKKKTITESKNELELELKILESSLESAADLTTGDRTIIEKKIISVQGKIELLENTVAGDIAVATTDFSLCSGKEDCECGKCALLKRPELKEAVIKASPFTGFFGS